jgi:TRAP-type mannitol/chloroaromatic compound transport system substrate-binding protein
MQIDIHPAPAIVGAFEVLEATHVGVLDATHTWAAYWIGMEPGAALFAGPIGGPFALDILGYMIWMHQAGGLELYQELYDDVLGKNVLVFPVGTEVPEPLGWFPEPIEDFEEMRGLKFRAAGLVAETYRQAGASVVILPAGEIVPALEKGVVEAAEFSDPVSDMLMGMHHAGAPYYILGSPQQPAGSQELLINRDSWNALPPDLQEIVRSATRESALMGTLMLLNESSHAMNKLVEEYGITLLDTPPDLSLAFLEAWEIVAARLRKESPFFARVEAHQREFASRWIPHWRRWNPDPDLLYQFYWER